MPPTPISTGINLNDVPVWDGNNYVSAPVPTGHTHGQLIATGSNCTLGIVTTTNLVATGSSPTFGIVTTTNLVATGSSPTFTNVTSSTGIFGRVTITATGTVANLSASFLEANPASQFSTTGHTHSFATTGHTHLSPDVVGVSVTGHSHVSSDVVGVSVTGHTHLSPDIVGIVTTGSSPTFGVVTTTNLVATGSSPTFGIVTTTNLVATGSSPTFGVVTTTNLVATGSSPTFATVTTSTGISGRTVITSGIGEKGVGGETVVALAGEAVVWGDLVYPSGGSYYKSDASLVTTMPAMAMAMGSAGAATGVSFLTRGFAVSSGWTWVASPAASGLVFVSGAAGVMTQTVPSTTADQVQVVGRATAANTLFFNPCYDTVEIV